MAATNGHTNGINGYGGSALCTAEEFVSQSYDFLVLGGGTAGLCVAVRLSEDPNITVGVIEAGKNLMDDKNVSTPSLYPTLIGRKEYDWCMTSIPQVQLSALLYPCLPKTDPPLANSPMLETKFTPCPVVKSWVAQVPSTTSCMSVAARRIMMAGLRWATEVGTGKVSFPTSRSTKR